MKKILSIILSVLALISLTGCGNDDGILDYMKNDTEAEELDLMTNVLGTADYRAGDENATYTEGKLLFDYYSTSWATTEDSIYDEITINEVDQALYVNVYEGNATEGTTTMHKAYVGTPELLNEVMDIINSNKVWEWNEDSYPGITGAIIVLKFMDPSGTLTRVSSENMPSDGEVIISDIDRILNSYLGNQTAFIDE